MTDVTPKVGSWYSLKGDYGTGHGMLTKGTQAQVTHIFPASTLGVGSIEPTVCVRFLEESSVTGRVCQRRVTFNAADFTSYFDTAKANAKGLKRWNDAQARKGGS